MKPNFPFLLDSFESLHPLPLRRPFLDILHCLILSYNYPTHFQAVDINNIMLSLLKFIFTICLFFSLQITIDNYWWIFALIEIVFNVHCFCLFVINLPLYFYFWLVRFSSHLTIVLYVLWRLYRIANFKCFFGWAIVTHLSSTILYTRYKNQHVLRRIFVFYFIGVFDFFFNYFKFYHWFSLYFFSQNLN